MKNQNYTIIKIWWKAIRFHFTPCSTLPAILGTIIAIYIESKFNLFNFVLLMISITLNHIAVNMTDDYYDFIQGVDISFKQNEKNPYSGGSGVLVSKEIKIKTMKLAFISLYFLTISIGIYFVVNYGFIILFLGLFGVFSSYFYTAPPIRFSYFGLGELSMLINLGPLITCGSYYLYTGSISMPVMLAGFILGGFVFVQIIFNEIPDYLNDKKVGKKTLVVIFGKEKSLYLSCVIIFLSYLLILFCIFNQYIPYTGFIVFLTIPTTYRSFSLIKDTLNKNKIRGNYEMVKVHVYIGSLLIISYAMDLLISGKQIIDTMLILLGLFILIFPVLLKFHKTSLEMRSREA